MLKNKNAFKNFFGISKNFKQKEKIDVLTNCELSPSVKDANAVALSIEKK